MSCLVCRNPASSDAAVTGLKGNSILQRFKLNNKVALITGDHCLLLALKFGTCRLCKTGNGIAYAWGVWYNVDRLQVEMSMSSALSGHEAAHV